MASKPLVSPSKASIKHPLDEFRKQWNASSHEGKEQFDYSEAISCTEDFFTLMVNSRKCMDLYNPGSRVACTCMEQLELSNEEVGRFTTYLINSCIMGHFSGILEGELPQGSNSVCLRRYFATIVSSLLTLTAI
jgi:hypothetical protein